MDRNYELDYDESVFQDVYPLHLARKLAREKRRKGNTRRHGRRKDRE